MKTYKFIFLILLSNFAISSLGNETLKQDCVKPDLFVLNSTIIKNGPAEMQTRGIDILEVYFLSVYCGKDMDLKNHQFHSKDFVEFNFDKTFYHHFEFKCVKDELDVCRDERFHAGMLEMPFLRDEEIKLTDGGSIHVNQARKYVLCEYKQHKMYTFYTREQRRHDLKITDEEFAKMDNLELLEFEKKEESMVREFFAKKNAEIEEYRKTLPVEKPVVGRKSFSLTGDMIEFLYDETDHQDRVLEVVGKIIGAVIAIVVILFCRCFRTPRAGEISS